MAEADVAATSRRYFCHQCVREVRPLLPDYNCSRCNNGFIEELDGDGHRSTDVAMDVEADALRVRSDDARESYSDVDRWRSRRRGYHPRTRNPGSNAMLDLPLFSAHSDPASGPSDGFGNPNIFLERFIQQMFGNLEMAFVRVDGGISSLGGFNGVLGDYAFGPNGLDNIITQLLNQLDNSGPPPADKSRIDSLPVLTITQKMIDDRIDCAVCQDAYKLHEEVKKLPCEHLFHSSCIDPWLQLHDSCPICRRTLSGDLPKAES